MGRGRDPRSGSCCSGGAEPPPLPALPLFCHFQLRGFDEIPAVPICSGGHGAPPGDLGRAGGCAVHPGQPDTALAQPGFGGGWSPSVGSRGREEGNVLSGVSPWCPPGWSSLWAVLSEAKLELPGVPVVSPRAGVASLMCLTSPHANSLTRPGPGQGGNCVNCVNCVGVRPLSSAASELQFGQERLGAA